MTLTTALLIAATVISAHMLVLWLISLPLRDVSIVDIGWGLGFAIVAWVIYFSAGAEGIYITTIAVLPTIWGLRLAGYLAWRNHGAGEDRRYAAMREKHQGRFWWVSLFKVFGLQGIVMWVVALPITVALATSSSDLSWNGLLLLGLLTWVVGFLFESIGDWQLARFKAKAENEGKVMDEGLWRYTRHPNYFGDFLVWWGHWLVSHSLTNQWWTVVSPLVMSVFLMKYSGVGLLESDITDRRPKYAEYKRRTNAFFPWPP